MLHQWYEMPTFKSWYRGIKRLFKIGFLCLWLWFKKRDKIRLVIYPAILLFALFVTKPAVQEWQIKNEYANNVVQFNGLQIECERHFSNYGYGWRDIYAKPNPERDNMLKTLEKVCKEKGFID